MNGKASVVGKKTAFEVWCRLEGGRWWWWVGRVEDGGSAGGRWREGQGVGR